MQKKDFDFIIAGAGAAGLSLLVRMISSGQFASKKILLIDKVAKTINDRTWCFWEQGSGFFENVVYKSWDKIAIHGDDYEQHTAISPYRYKMIRGIDFYRQCLGIIKTQPNITIKYANVQAVRAVEGQSAVMLNDQVVFADYVFNSIRFDYAVSHAGKYNMLQHFTGWIVEAETSIFDDQTANLMDFRTPQDHGCSFVYTLPFSATTALVEYTEFSSALLSADEYALALRGYLSRQFPGVKYAVRSSEYGVIPMSDYHFPDQDGHVIHIGTAGGQTKPSTGYTFQFIQKRTAEIVTKLANNPPDFRLSKVESKYQFYDRVLLNVLATGKQKGSDVFLRLFKKNPTSRIFRFLDNESSLADDFRIISSLPVMPFLRASFE